MSDVSEASAVTGLQRHIGQFGQPGQFFSSAWLMQPRQPDDKELAKLYRWTLHTRWGVLDDRDAAGQYAASVGALNALRAMIVQPQIDRQFEAHFRGRHLH